MTHEEFMALPDVTPRLGHEVKLIDGKHVSVPKVISGHLGALWQEDEDTFVTLTNGDKWMVGRIKGQRVRTRMN